MGDGKGGKKSYCNSLLNFCQASYEILTLVIMYVDIPANCGEGAIEGKPQLHPPPSPEKPGVFTGPRKPVNQPPMDPGALCPLVCPGVWQSVTKERWWWW